MTEAEWARSTEAAPMLEFLRGRSSDRKLRLFAVACCRRVWESLKNKRSRRAAKIAEKYAEGVVNDMKLRAVYTAAYDAFVHTDGDSIEELTAWIAADVAASDAYLAATSATKVADLVAHVGAYGLDTSDSASTEATEAVYCIARRTEQAMQSCLLRCIIGNPYRHVTINPLWLAWKESTVVKLAQSMHEERASDPLPVLADALEDAGCDNADILAHCRGPGPHVRGCWVVDLILGKQ